MWQPATATLLDQCERDRDRLRQCPWPPDVLATIHDALIPTFVWASNALEGYSLTLAETAVALDGGYGSPTSAREHANVRDHAAAFTAMWELVAAHADLAPADVRALHQLLIQKTLPRAAGVWRRGPVRLAGTDHVPPPASDVAPLMTVWVRRCNVASTGYPLLVNAARLHHDFKALHPFEDGNGRTGRLLTAFYLLRRGIPPCVILPEERPAYLDALDQARTNQWNPLVQLMARGVHRTFQQFWEPRLPR